MSGKREKKEKKEKIAEVTLEEIKKLTEISNAMHVVLVGAEPSPLNPYPDPGLVTTVPELLRRTTKIENTLFKNGGAGNTVLDRLGRIEEAASANQITTDSIEQHQSDQEKARVKRED